MRTYYTYMRTYNTYMRMFTSQSVGAHVLTPPP